MKKDAPLIEELKKIIERLALGGPSKDLREMRIKLAQAEWSDHPNRKARMVYGSHIRRGHSQEVAIKAAWNTLPK